MRDDDTLLTDTTLPFGSGVIGICDVCGTRQAVIVLSKERFKLCVIDFLNKSWLNSKSKPGAPLPLYRSDRVWFPTEATAEGKAPAVVLSPTKAVKRPVALITPDVYGLTTSVLDAAVRLAREGFEVLLPDAGKTSSIGPLDHVSLHMGGARGVAVESPRVRHIVTLYADALRFLRGRDMVDAEKSAVFGLSYGGSLAVALAGTDLKLSAVALAYPMPVKPPEFLKLVTAPVFVVAGGRDVAARRFVSDLRTARGAGAAPLEVFEPAGVRHHFLGRDLRAYDVGAAEEAWRQAISFLKARLMPAPPKPPTPPKAIAPAAMAPVAPSVPSPPSRAAAG